MAVGTIQPSISTYSHLVAESTARRSEWAVEPAVKCEAELFLDRPRLTLRGTMATQMNGVIQRRTRALEIVLQHVTV